MQTKWKPIAVLLVVCLLIIGTVPAIAAPAEATVETAFDYDKDNLVVSGNWAENAYGSVTIPTTNGTARDSGHLTYYTSYGAARSTFFQWITVKSSDPDVITAQVSVASNGDMVVNFQAHKIGNATITIEYTANVRFINGINTGNTQSYYPNGQVIYNAEVNNSGEESSSSSSEESSSDSSSEESSSDSSSEDSSSDSSSEESSSDSSSEESASASESKSESGSKSYSYHDSSSKDSASQSKSSSSSKDIPDTGAVSGTGATVALAGLSAVMIAALAVAGKKYGKK